MFYIVEKIINSNIYEMKEFIDSTISNFKDKLCEENLFDLKLILDELIYNSISHGNNFNENKKIKVFVSICDMRIRVEVTDEGSGIYYDLNKFNPDSLVCGGRGLFIVNNLSDEFKINGNKVISVKYRTNIGAMK